MKHKETNNLHITCITDYLNVADRMRKYKLGHFEPITSIFK